MGHKNEVYPSACYDWHPYDISCVAEWAALIHYIFINFVGATLFLELK